jgi:hypothetical protein
MEAVMSAGAVQQSRPYLIWGAGAFVAAAVIIILGNTDVKKGENGSIGWLFVNLAIVAVLVPLLYGLLVPGSTNPDRTGLIFGILSVLSLGAFWAAIPVVIGPVAVALGLRGSSGQAKAALILGGLATVVGLVGGIIGAVA